MALAPVAMSIRPLGGLDLLRLAAMGFVTIQHVLTLTHHDRWTTLRSFNVGQFGVAIFLGISALLGSLSRRSPASWLLQRFIRLYPPYWLAMALCFLIVWVTNYKQFGILQFFSQMIGIGLITHPTKLINVPTWFITILIACYIGLFLTRISAYPLLMNTIFLAATAAWIAVTGNEWPWMHFITFFIASALTFACPTKWRAGVFAAVGIGLFTLSPMSIAFAYTGLTLLSIGAASVVLDVPRRITIMAEYSYEYYLVHGMFLIGTTSALGDHPVMVVACGVPLAAMAAFLLHGVVDVCRSIGSGRTSRQLYSEKP